MKKFILWQEKQRTRTNITICQKVTYDDAFGTLVEFKEKVGPGRTEYTTTFGYDEENRPTNLSYGGYGQSTLTYDKLGRVRQSSVKAGSGTAMTTTYAFVEGGHGTNSTTGLVKSISQAGGNFTYTYDDNGNIVSVVQDGKKTEYAYDALGQLIRVDDGQENVTWVYTYDQGGNILSKKKYALGITTGEPTESKTFTYGNANWKDQLTAVNGVAITYDAIGNPLSDGEWTYTWQNGRQLASMSKSGTTASFKYNENGLRVQKTVNGVVTDYTLHGKTIVHVKQGSNNLHFFYDAQNKPAMVIFNGTAYAYLYNLQGDVIGLIDSTGTKMVSYTYDVWGKPISKTGTLASTLGTIQPFRYRGYVYDEETGLHYLRSRYYSSRICRFITPDSLLQKRHLLLGDNLFHYCKANPINKVDNDGYGDIYVIYYHWDGSKSSLKTQAQNAPYYDWETVKGLEVASSADFINAWNSMDDSDLDEVYIFVHGSPGSLNMDYDEICSDGEYSFDQLENKEIKNTIFLFSCYGAATDSNNSSVAVQLMNRTSAPKLYACEVGVSFSKIIAPGSARVTMKHYFDGVPYWAEYARDTNGIKKRLLDKLILKKE